MPSAFARTRRIEVAAVAPVTLATGTEADELAEASAASAEETSAAIDGADVFKLSMMGDLKAASDATLDANKMLSDAVDAAEEAERIESLAELAMVEMDAAIEQHLIDFPDSELRDQLD